MKISELANETGSSVETIRYYEKQGLLPEPARTSANYRMYGDAHIARLRFIRHCRYLDMTHQEIRRLLAFCDSPQESCSEVNALLDRHIEHVAERISELHALQRHLRELRRQCAQVRTAKDCGILQSLAETGPQAGAVHSHVAGAHRHTR